MNEVVAPTADAVSGSKTVPSRPGMNKTEAQMKRSNLKDSQVDPSRDDKEKEFVAETAPESIIWRSRLRPRNTGVVA